MKKVVIFILLVFGHQLQAQTPDTPDPSNDEAFKDLITKNSLTESESFRCGIFFAGENLNDKPRDVIYILPKRFPTDCSTDNNAEVKEFCLSLFKKFVGFLTWRSTSKKRKEPYNIGDDVCDGALRKTGIKRPPPNPRFPNGVTVGFYYNVCTDVKWYDTELRVAQNICCTVEGDEWRYTECPGEK